MEAHGWRLFVHPLFQAQLEKLATRVGKLASTDPAGYVSHPATKMLATINHYIRDAIPRDPNGAVGVVGLGEIVRVRERATRAARTAPAGPTQLAARRVVVLAHERVRELDGAILVVDDEKVIRDILADFLKEEGYVVHTVEDGSQAIEELRKASYNLVISDLKMPKMGGLELVQKIAEESIPVLTVSSDLSPSGRLCYVGCDYYQAGRIAGTKR